MLTPEEFKRWWSYSTPLVTIPRSVLKGVAIPDEAKQFLHKAGVPTDGRLGFPIQVRLPPLPYAFPDTALLSAAYARYRVFGEINYKYYACLDEEENGRIVFAKIHDGFSA